MLLYKKGTAPIFVEPVDFDVNKVLNYLGNEATPFVNITYNRPVNGYEVEVIFYPENELSTIITGSAKVIFTHTNPYRQNEIKCAYFSFSMDKFPDYKNLASFAKAQHYSFDYTFPENSDETLISLSLIDRECFFFEDINFDGKPELIITKESEGQTCVLLDIYTITEDGTFEKPAFQLPYLTDFSTIDRENRQIIIEHQHGLYESYKEIYKIDENGKFYMAEKIKIQY